MGMLDEVKAKKKQKAAQNWMKMADSAKTIEKKIEYYTKSLDVDPYNAEAWFKKGKSLEQLGRFEEAKRSFDLAVEIDPDYQGLIGRKYEPMASRAAPAVSPVQDREVVAPARSQQTEDEGQWVTETPEAAVVEDDLMGSESRESEYSFIPPAGDESLFSDVLGAADDNGSPASVEKDDEDVFGSGLEDQFVAPEPEIIPVPDDITEEDYEEPSYFAAESTGITKEDEASHFAAVSDGVKKEEDAMVDTFSSPVPAREEEPAYAGHDENTIGSTEPIRSTPEYIPPEDRQPVIEPAAYRPEAVASVQAPGSSGDSMSKPSSVPVSSVISGAGEGPVDIRIPLSEAIKFWAIGIVAMLIVLVLSSIL